METRHSEDIERFLDRLMDYGVAQITDTEFKRYYGISRIGHRLKQNFENKILERIEAEYEDPENCTVQIYSRGGTWTFTLNDDEAKIQALSSWAGSD